MRFTKMHGIGNDYVYVNGFDPANAIDDPAALARVIADRHFGVGGDGLILVLPPEPGVEADVRMRMFNADGSEAEMCGNGIRCVCKFAYDHAVTPSIRDANPMRVQTGRGVLSLAYTVTVKGSMTSGIDSMIVPTHAKACSAESGVTVVDRVTVDMGEPILEPGEVPVDVGQLKATDQPQTFEVKVEGLDEPLTATFVSMGNPHAVIYMDDVMAIDLPGLGAKLEHHLAFPKRMNVHFVQVQSRDEVKVRHWERGSGPTLACGTGACAVCVAGVLIGRTNRNVITHLPGGDLELEWREKGEHVFMTGPAVEVFSGEWGSQCGNFV